MKIKSIEFLFHYFQFLLIKDLEKINKGHKWGGGGAGSETTMLL